MSAALAACVPARRAPCAQRACFAGPVRRRIQHSWDTSVAGLRSMHWADPPGSVDPSKVGYWVELTLAIQSFVSWLIVHICKISTCTYSLLSPTMTTLNIAIVGSGPAGMYLVEALLKSIPKVLAVDVIDRLPTPFGLIRSGVAPDHASVRTVTRRFEQTLDRPGVRFVGGIEIGRDVPLEQLRRLYDAVVLANGCPVDRSLGIPGEQLPGVWGSARFTGWYNAHPDHSATDIADLAETVVVI